MYFLFLLQQVVSWISSITSNSNFLMILLPSQWNYRQDRHHWWEQRPLEFQRGSCSHTEPDWGDVSQWQLETPSLTVLLPARTQSTHRLSLDPLSVGSCQPSCRLKANQPALWKREPLGGRCRPLVVAHRSTLLFPPFRVSVFLFCV